MEYSLNKEGTELISNILHKYYRIDQRFINLLVNNEMWFSNPEDFNDPYDCNLTIDCENTYDEIYNHLKKFSQEQRLNQTNREIQDSAKYWFKNPDELKGYLRKNQKEELDRKGIACFSKSDEILLMWSHYSDSHKGVCLTFNISKDNEFFSLPFVVDYPEFYPKTNFIREENRRIRYKRIIATKSVGWKYEEEIRILKDTRDHGQSRGNIKFNKESLREIKFGHRTNPKDIETIKKIILNQGYKHVKLYKAKLKEGEFGIDFIEIG